MDTTPSTRTDTIANFGTAVVVACALILTVTLLRDRHSAAVAAAPLETPVRIDNWRAIADSGILVGAANAPIKVTVFSDFQCPFCAAADSVLWRLATESPSQVALSFHDYPLTLIHPNAAPAAIAARCANAQGKYGAYHKILFANQSAIGIRSWEGFAKDAGVSSLDQFKTCVNDKVPDKAIAKDVELGRSLHVGGTPTIMVNELMFPGGTSITEVEREIKKRIATTEGARS